MLILYYKPSCAYCQNVLGEAEILGVSFRLKDISSDQTLKDELVSLGGKQQVPFLIDDVSGVHMYESEDIIEYIRAQESSKPALHSFGGLKIHTSPEVCDTCQ